MRARLLNVNAVLVGERYRRDLGDLTALIRSMDREGQRQPIVVLDNHELLAGERRLEAARALGWPTIQAYTVRTVEEAVNALRADWASADQADVCLAMRWSERVSQVEPLRALHARERKIPPKNLDRAQRWAYQVEPIMADLLGTGMTYYRMIRLAVETSLGRRPYGGRPVTDLDRKLAQQAVDQMDSGAAVDTVGTRLRAQLGYPPSGRLPTLPTDPERIPQKLIRSPRPSTARRPPLRDQVSAAVSQASLAARRLHKLANDDRWQAQHGQIPPAVRASLTEAVELLTAVQRQIPAPTSTPKETP